MKKNGATNTGRAVLFTYKEKLMSDVILTDEVQRHKNMLLALAGLNFNREGLSILCEYSDITMSTEQDKYLRGPVITAKNPWASAMHVSLNWMFEGVAHARLSRIFSEQSGQQALASEVEVAIVMQPYTMESPMNTEWTNVFMWAAGQASLAYQTNSRHSKEERVQAFAEMGVKPLTHYEEQQYYNHIAADIRRKVVTHATKPKAVRPTKRLTEVADIPRANESIDEYEARMNGSAAFDPSYIEQIFAQMEKRVKEKEETAAFDASYIEQIFAQMESRKG